MQSSVDNRFLWETSFLKGVYIFCPPIFEDIRGGFVKTYHEEMFKELGINFESKEEYFSINKKNVLRGMHFQKPPYEHNKIVTCLSGSVLDVLLDLRSNEATFGQFWSVNLSAKNRKVLYIPKGIAHGFLALEDKTIMSYKCSTIQNKDAESGIAWNSFGFNWSVPIEKLIISERDNKHIKFSEFPKCF